MALSTPTPGIERAAVADVLAIGSFAAAHGWTPATSGNFSSRVDDRRIAITRSGVDKNALTPSDVLILNITEPLPPDASAETPLHVARYSNDHTIGMVVHVHSVAATVLSRVAATDGFLYFSDYEMQKAFHGIHTHEGRIALPVFANSQLMPELALEVEALLGASPHVAPGFLLGGHGLYTWGRDRAEAQRHLEALEFLMTCDLEERRLR
jgi:methylthioribulose-1-phosphate dehydratase